MILFHDEGLEMQVMLVSQSALLRTVTNAEIIARWCGRQHLGRSWFLQTDFGDVCRIFTKPANVAHAICWYYGCTWMPRCRRPAASACGSCTSPYFDQPVPVPLLNLPTRTLDILKSFMDAPSSRTPARRKRTAAQVRRQKEQADTEALCKPNLGEWCVIFLLWNTHDQGRRRLSPLSACTTSASSSVPAAQNERPKNVVRMLNNLDDGVFLDLAASTRDPACVVKGLPSLELVQIIWEAAILFSDFTTVHFRKEGQIGFTARGEIGSMKLALRPSSARDAASKSKTNGNAKPNGDRSGKTHVAVKKRHREPTPTSAAACANIPFRVCFDPQRASDFKVKLISRSLLFSVPSLRMSAITEIGASPTGPLTMRYCVFGSEKDAVPRLGEKQDGMLVRTNPSAPRSLPVGDPSRSCVVQTMIVTPALTDLK